MARLAYRFSVLLNRNISFTAFHHRYCRLLPIFRHRSRALTMAPSVDFSGADFVRPDATYDTSKLAGKSVVVTGAGSGLGEAFLREYVKAGAFVTFGDLADDRCHKIVEEIGEDKVCFVHCNVLDWHEQLHLFRTALEKSPSESIDIVVANAGISGHDDLASDETETNGEPKEPDVSLIKIDLISVVYTAKLALHYLAKQNEGSDTDRSLILVSSIAAYVDKPGSPQYNAAKFGVRGLMRCLRTTMPERKMRVNVLAPWSVTPLKETSAAGIRNMLTCS